LSQTEFWIFFNTLIVVFIQLIIVYRVHEAMCVQFMYKQESGFSLVMFFSISPV
jgi:hypothetical protein